MAGIKAETISAGDRIAVSNNGKSYTRTVTATGKDFVVIQIMGMSQKIPEHRITSHISVGR